MSCFGGGSSSYSTYSAGGRGMFGHSSFSESGPPRSEDPRQKRADRLKKALMAVVVAGALLAVLLTAILRAPQDRSHEGDLGLVGVSVQNPTCDGSAYVMVGSVPAADTAAARAFVTAALRADPTVRYMNSDASCKNVRMTLGDSLERLTHWPQQSYALYHGPFDHDTAQQQQAAVSGAPPGPANPGPVRLWETNVGEYCGC